MVQSLRRLPRRVPPAGRVAAWPCCRVLDTLSEDVGGEGAGLEGVHVALDGGLGFGQLGVGGRQFVVIR